MSTSLTYTLWAVVKMCRNSGREITSVELSERIARMKCEVANNCNRPDSSVLRFEAHRIPHPVELCTNPLSNAPVLRMLGSKTSEDL